METLTKRSIIIDLKQATMLSTPQFIQQDSNILEFTVLENGADADLTNIGKIVVNYKRSDKKVISRLLYAEGNKITYEIGQEEMEIHGEGELEIQFYSSDILTRISSRRFKINLSESIGTTSISEGDENVTLLQQLMIEVTELNTQVTDAESLRVSAENTRIANENTRIENENARSLAETDRNNAEQLRVQQENERQTNISTTITNVETATTNANNAATIATEKANLADVAAQEANTAKLEAETATNAINLVLPNVEGLEFIALFDPTVSYVKNNIVRYGKNAYIALQDTLGNEPTGTTDSPYWGVLAVGGVDGTGSVVTVNGISPDINGNVQITIPDPDLSDYATTTQLTTVDNKIGDLSTLETTEKGSLVEAVNENTTQLAQKAQQVGMILDVPQQVAASEKFKINNDFTNPDDYYEDYINSKWEVLRNANLNYMTREIRGLDSSGLFNIYKYEIKNNNNYKKTIMIQAGIHGWEKHGAFTIYNLIEALVNSPKTKNKYLEEVFNNVRFIIVPILNPYGFTRNSRKNFNGVDLNRNYSAWWDTTDEGLGTDWYKGTTPFSEPESVISRDLVKEIKPDLFIDIHSNVGHAYDLYADSDYYNENWYLLDKILKSALAKKKAEYPEYTLASGNIHHTNNDYSSKGYMYASRILGVPSYVAEWCADSYDGAYSSLEMTKALELFFNIIYYNYLYTSYKFRNAHPRDTLGINSSNKPTNMYNFMDAMPLTKKTFGKDASGTYDIHYYENTHSSDIKKNVLVLGGLTGDFHVSAVTVGSVIERLVYDNDEKYNLTIVPWLNTWGGMQSTPQVSNANAVDLSTDFASLSQVETQYLNNLITTNKITDIIHIDNKVAAVTNKVPVLKQEFISLNFKDDGVVYTNSTTYNKILAYAKNKKVKCISIGSNNNTQFGQIIYTDFTIKFSEYAMNIIKGLVSTEINSSKILRNKVQYPVVTNTAFTSVTGLEETFVAEEDGMYMITGTVVILRSGTGITWICPVLLKEGDYTQGNLDSRFVTDDEYTDLVGRVQLSFSTSYNANKGDSLKFALYVKTDSDVTIYRTRTNRVFFKNCLLERINK